MNESPIEELSQKVVDSILAALEAHLTPPRWLTVAVAARYCSASTTTILRWINSAQVYAAKRGGQWYVDRLDIDTFMTTRRAHGKRLARKN